MQAQLGKVVTLPLLPERERHEPSNAPSNVTVRFQRLGCDEVHAKGAQANNHEYVKWPEELTYTATAHGPFPFWDKFPGTMCPSCDQDLSAHSLKVRYSAKSNSEILMHESCGNMAWTGGSGAPNKSPCNHIFTPDQGAFIYTPKVALEPDADGKFCCRSVAKDSDQITGAVPRDWSKSGTYKGTYENFKGDHYSGTIKMFQWDRTGIARPFWYYTTLDGYPVQQGEACEVPKGKKPHVCGEDAPPTSWHDFVPGTFKNATFVSADFVVPDVCKNTAVSCLVPGNN